MRSTIFFICKIIRPLDHPIVLQRDTDAQPLAQRVCNQDLASLARNLMTVTKRTRVFLDFFWHKMTCRTQCWSLVSTLRNILYILLNGTLTVTFSCSCRYQSVSFSKIVNLLIFNKVPNTSLLCIYYARRLVTLRNVSTYSSVCVRDTLHLGKYEWLRNVRGSYMRHERHWMTNKARQYCNRRQLIPSIISKQ
jgi:hypothetical protein